LLLVGGFDTCRSIPTRSRLVIEKTAEQKLRL